MAATDSIVLLLVAVCLAFVVFRPVLQECWSAALWGIRAFVEAISNGGNPPTPMHPSPSDDATLLGRRPKRSLVNDNGNNRATSAALR